VAHTRPLVELSRGEEGSFGGKSAFLGELLTAAIPVPPGFALSVSAFRAFMSESGLDRRVADLTAALTPGDVDAIGGASHAISEAMRFAPVPRAVHQEIADRYEELAALSQTPDPPVAVRSSALGEDSQDATFAGQQETYLWVRGTDQVCDAVRDCWVSLYSTPAISYRARLADRRSEVAMGVAVQLMVDAEVSGVMFTCNPVSGDPSMIAINASWGLGLAVVGGEATPDDYLVSKVTREVVREHVHTKDVQYVPDPDGHGAVRTHVPDERRDARVLEQGDLERLVDVARRIERYFGSHQDIEWALPRGDADSVLVVQTRPVTAVSKKPTKPKAESAMSLIMSTFGAGPRPQ
jgi:phosphoenolpyruvate synthase/pyruvate phosphate dikinase